VISHGEQPPVARHALQLVTAAVGELDPRAHDKILDGARNEHLRPFARSSPPSTAPRRESAGHRLDELPLLAGQRIAYVFDFQEEWRARLTLREITARDGGHQPRVLESVGDTPPQYLEDEELDAV
jgi:Plasmid pRiA4b ORF-3-like protein